MDSRTLIKVRKRDGRIVPFDKNRIKEAIRKASIASGCLINDYNLDELTKKIVSNLIKEDSYLSILDINDIEKTVENILMDSEYKEIAREYIGFRRHRSIARQANNDLIKDINILFRRKEDNKGILSENANKDSNNIPTQRDLLAGIVSKDFAKKFLLPNDVRINHDEGYIHFHDLDYSPMFEMFNCMLIDFPNMLSNGFKLGNADIVSPKGITTATAITAQIIAQVASNIYGGNTFNNIDLVLAPYVRLSFIKHFKSAMYWFENVPEDDLVYRDNKYLQIRKGYKEKITPTNPYLLENFPKVMAYAIDKTVKEVYDAFQGLEYEINTLNTSNGQTPFVTLGFGLGTSWESREIQKAILKNRIAGLGSNKKTAIFPKLVFVLKKGLNLNPEDPNYDIKQLALECSVKRMYPDVVMYDKIIEITGSFKFPMGCRSFLGVWKDENGNEVTFGRNNMGVVTINLPRIALETSNEEEFYNLLDEKLEVCKKALLYRISILMNIVADRSPILYIHGAMGRRFKSGENVSEIFKNGRASISLGYIGIHEAIYKLYGKKMFGNEEITQKGIDLIKYLRSKTDEWKKETGYGFSLYGTPSESLCNRFEKIDREKFGVIEGITDKTWYTNSFHLDVTQKCNAFEKIDFESRFQPYSSGGFITYSECNSLLNNPEALEVLWDYSYDKLGYFAINVPVDKCFKCGFEGEFTPTAESFKCPNCGNNEPLSCSCIRRISGYLSEPSQRKVNIGKHDEIASRYKHY